MSLVDGGTGSATPFGAAGSIAVGGSAPVVASAGTAGLGGTSGASGSAGRPNVAGSAGTSARDPEPCDPDGNPLDPTHPTPCVPEAPHDDCDDVAREYEVAVGIAQWCDTNADCRAGTAVRSTLHCGCDVIVRTVSEIAPLAAQWRAQGCVNELPCSAICAPPDMPFRCGEAGFCVHATR